MFLNITNKWQQKFLEQHKFYQAKFKILSGYLYSLGEKDFPQFSTAIFPGLQKTTLLLKPEIFLQIFLEFPIMSLTYFM